jgi:TPR repeat protein
MSSQVWAKSAQDLEASCNSGYFEACLTLGMVYQKGQFKGVTAKKDKALAKKFIDRGVQMAEDNCASASAKDCYYIGHMFFEGGMVPTDMPRGLRYLQKSCQYGYKKACDWLDNSGLPQR